MTYVFDDPYDVQTPADGDDILAAYGRVLRQDALALLGPPRIRAYLAGPKSISDFTLTAVQFDAKLGADLWGMHSTSSDNTKIVAQRAGDYEFGVTVAWEPNTSGTYRHVELQVNGAVVIDEDVTVPSVSGGFATHGFTTQWPDVVVGDYFEVFVKHDAAGPLDVVAHGYAGTIFWAKFVGKDL